MDSKGFAFGGVAKPRTASKACGKAEVLDNRVRFLISYEGQRPSFLFYLLETQNSVSRGFQRQSPWRCGGATKTAPIKATVRLRSMFLPKGKKYGANVKKLPL